VTAAGRFSDFIVIDWSGENVARPKGMAVATANRGSFAPALLTPAGGWSRQTILDHLIAHAAAKSDLLIGLDLSPGLPFVDEGAYFPDWARSPADAKQLWALVDAMSAANPHLGVGSFLGDADVARHFRQQTRTGDLFPRGSGRLRETERAQHAHALRPSSCFNLIGAAQVGKSSLTGMRVLHRLGGRVPVWPFDPVPAEGPVIVEIYTAIAACAAGIRKGLSKIRDAATLDAALAKLGSAAHQPLAGYDDHATDAILTAAWLRLAVRDPGIWHPATMTSHIAATEGWTFGVT
jgi:hypothetical protein